MCELVLLVSRQLAMAEQPDRRPDFGLHAWNDGFYAVVSARRESVSGASKRYVFTAVGRSGLGLHFPFSGIFTQPPLFWLWLFLSYFRLFAQILLHCNMLSHNVLSLPTLPVCPCLENVRNGGIAPMCVRCVVSSNTDCFRKRW